MAWHGMAQCTPCLPDMRCHFPPFLRLQVCDDGWGQAEAGVLCRQLGHTSGTVLASSIFGQNRQLDILLDDVACTGREASLAGCSYSVGGSDCGHFEDLAVECTSAPACPAACLPGIWRAGKLLQLAMGCFPLGHSLVNYPQPA